MQRKDNKRVNVHRWECRRCWWNCKQTYLKGQGNACGTVGYEKFGDTVRNLVDMGK